MEPGGHSCLVARVRPRHRFWVSADGVRGLVVGESIGHRRWGRAQHRIGPDARKPRHDGEIDVRRRRRHRPGLAEIEHEGHSAVRFKARAALKEELAALRLVCGSPPADHFRRLGADRLRQLVGWCRGGARSACRGIPGRGENVLGSAATSSQFGPYEVVLRGQQVSEPAGKIRPLRKRVGHLLGEFADRPTYLLKVRRKMVESKVLEDARD
jgi:hypothetical protein